MDFEEYLRMQTYAFVQYYRCRPMSALDKENVDNDGNRIIMPASALDTLSSLNVEYPMQFQIKNPSTHQTLHCGVLEFVAEEGFVYIQSWMMERLGLRENDLVLLKNTSLPKAEFVKLQPHTMDFLKEVSDPRDVLQYNFGKYSCMTTGDTITVTAGDDGERRYLLDVVEARPADAVSMLETDCEVEFALPFDCKQPEPVAVAVAAQEAQQPARFTGAVMRLDGRPVEQPSAPPAPAPEAQQPARFTGAVMRLDGRPVEQQPPPQASPAGARSSVRPKRALQFGSTVAGGSSTKGDGNEKEVKRFAGHKYSLQRQDD